MRVASFIAVGNSPAKAIARPTVKKTARDSVVETCLHADFHDKRVPHANTPKGDLNIWLYCLYSVKRGIIVTGSTAWNAQPPFLLHPFKDIDPEEYHMIYSHRQESSHPVFCLAHQTKVRLRRIQLQSSQWVVSRSLELKYHYNLLWIFSRLSQITGKIYWKIWLMFATETLCAPRFSTWRSTF